MSSFDELVAALGARKQEIYQTNPWLGAGSSVLKQDYYDPRSSNASNLGAALLSGFGGGMMRGYGKSQAEQEYLDEATALGSALDMQGPQRMEAVDANPALQPYKPLILLGQKRDEEEQQQMAAKIQQQKDMMDYQQQAKAKYAIAKPMGNRPSNLEKEYDFVSKTQGPEAAAKYLEKETGQSPMAVSIKDPAEAPASLEELLHKRGFKKGEDGKAAIKELGLLQSVKASTDNIDKSWGTLRNIKALDSLDPTDKNWGLFESAILDALPALRPIFGVLSEGDKAVVMRQVPTSKDRPELVDQKIAKMKELMRRKIQSPNLDVIIGPEQMGKYRKSFLEDSSPRAATAAAPIEEAQDSAGAAWRIIRGPNGQPIGKVRK